MRALITGITGQDGSYLADYLLAKPGYVVHGVTRRSSTPNRERIAHLIEGEPGLSGRFHLHLADLTDEPSLIRLMDEVRPDEVYNLVRRATSGCRSIRPSTRPTWSGWGPSGSWRRSGIPVAPIG
jgi:GDPmannose 4,6-dehydratase